MSKADALLIEKNMLLSVIRSNAPLSEQQNYRYI
jgi:hypothetical protein